MTMETWTITYSKDDVREVPAKLGFDTPGTVIRYRTESEVKDRQQNASR